MTRLYPYRNLYFSPLPNPRTSLFPSTPGTLKKLRQYVATTITGLFSYVYPINFLLNTFSPTPNSGGEKRDAIRNACWFLCLLLCSSLRSFIYTAAAARKTGAPAIALNYRITVEKDSGLDSRREVTLCEGRIAYFPTVSQALFRVRVFSRSPQLSLPVTSLSPNPSSLGY